MEESTEIDGISLTPTCDACPGHYEAFRKRKRVG